MLYSGLQWIEGRQTPERGLLLW